MVLYKIDEIQKVHCWIIFLNAVPQRIIVPILPIRCAVQYNIKYKITFKKK